MTGETVHTAAGFTIDRIVVGPLETNVYLIRDTGSDAAALVDAADEPGRILEFARGASVVEVLTTHGHHDHHGAVPQVPDALGVPFLLHPDDATIAGKQPDAPLVEGTRRIGDLAIDVVHTPGHTPGSVCLLLDGVAITGDTLFPGGPGATRFPYSSFDEIIESITTTVFTLPDHTVVLPGHGAPTTVGTERPHLRAWIERGW